MACCPGPILAWQWWHADILILGVQSSIWRIPHTFFPLVQKKSSLLQKVTQNPQTAFPENEHFTCVQRQINANQPQDLTISQSATEKQTKSMLLFLCDLVFKGDGIWEDVEVMLGYEGTCMLWKKPVIIPADHFSSPASYGPHEENGDPPLPTPCPCK